ncbi:MAG: glycoside hydrolase family 127 protein [Flavobacteriales bacterium]|nr:glycoside hydrolase family 127 protein [Flavobacteriales bacterium]MCB9913334.1 glycoside hydrolase family 127 protein [Planctomycetota bacterium]MCP5524381.1 glycoside hydrolase family 127 protein [Verrucomicrobiales bacterium]
MVEERQHRDWWWIGEQVGKWIESAVLSSAHSDKGLREEAERMLRRVIASQEPGGYVGITARDMRTPAKPLRGMDPYELYFTLHAFITAYEQWGDQEALRAAERLGDYFVSSIAPGKAEFWPGKLRPPANRGEVLAGQSEIAGHSVHYSWEGTLLIDPMTRLAQVTGNRKYADWSQWVAGRIDRWSGWNSFSKLDEVAAGTMGIHEVQPYVHSHTFQMNFLGFLRLYEFFGDASYLRKVAGAWDDIASRQMYITGGVSVAEHYEAGHIKPVSGHAVETCATMSWLQVTQYLLELTGDSKYADAMERLLWNHVFASQAIDGDSYRYHTPPNGQKPAGYFHGPDCCTSSGHRLVSLMPTFLYGKDDQGVFVNQYGATTAEVTLSDGRVIRLRQETEYPESSTVTITVDSTLEAPTAIRLRLPGWCGQPEVRVNGVSQNELTPGSYLSIERSWKRGDLILLEFPMELKWVRSDAPWRTVETRLPGGEIMHQPVPGDTPPWALTRGPVVYAVDTLWWSGSRLPPPENAGGDLAVVPDLSHVKKVPKPDGIVGPAYEVAFVETSGESVRTLMVPFTNIGRWYRPGQAKPNPQDAAYSYAVWLQGADSPAFKERMMAVAQAKEKYAHAVDYVLIGDGKSEASHRVQGGSVGKFQERTYRDGSDFSYTLKMRPGKDGKLVVMYWGGDIGRVFDVLANDRVLRTQRLQDNRPGEFYEEVYDVPWELIRGRTDDYGQPVERVSIRFKSRTQDVAGGIFGLRME